MLLWYDWRLALLSMAFLPVSYAIAERMKRPVQRTGAAFKEQAGALNAATMDRAVNALTYRVFGREEERRAAYEESLTAYERAAVKANLWTASLPPLYRVLSMIGAALILYFGRKNVLGTGWTVWSIAEFTTFLACFTKLATKSSKAAKLFNAVHKAQVSWKRIQPLMREIPAVPAVSAGRVERLEIRDLTCGYPGDEPLFSGLDLTACRGQIIGVTGPVPAANPRWARRSSANSPTAAASGWTAGSWRSCPSGSGRALWGIWAMTRSCSAARSGKMCCWETRAIPWTTSELCVWTAKWRP